jgi:hypothetical protein
MRLRYTRSPGRETSVVLAVSKHVRADTGSGILDRRPWSPVNPDARSSYQGRVLGLVPWLSSGIDEQEGLGLTLSKQRPWKLKVNAQSGRHVGRPTRR